LETAAPWPAAHLDYFGMTDLLHTASEGNGTNTLGGAWYNQKHPQSPPLSFANFRLGEQPKPRIFPE